MLEVKNLQKYYGRKKILDGFNLCIKKGDVFGLIGINGAGKSTLFQICTGLLWPDSGIVRLSGCDVFSDINFVHEVVGYLPENFGVYEDVTVLEYIQFYGALYGLSSRRISYWRELLELVNLGEQIECTVGSIPRSMKQRLGVARGLVHNPAMLILDEPLANLDPLGKQEMIKVIQRLKKAGKTILLSSNVLTEVEEVCTQVGIINHGKMFVQGTIDEVIEKLNSKISIEIVVVEGKTAAIELLKKNQNVTRITVDEEKLIIGFRGSEWQEAALLTELTCNGVAVSSFGRMKGNLENLFIEITRDTERRGEWYEGKSSLSKRFKIKRQRS